MLKNPPPLAIYPSRAKTVVLVAISATLIVLPVIALLVLRERIEDIKVVSYRLLGSSG
jgi:hypothetical protein